MRSVGSPQVITVIILLFMAVMMVYGVAVFLPSIVSQLGFSPNAAQLLSMGPFTAGFFGECFGIFNIYQLLHSSRTCTHQGVLRLSSFPYLLAVAVSK